MSLLVGDEWEKALDKNDRKAKLTSPLKKQKMVATSKPWKENETVETWLF